MLAKKRTLNRSSFFFSLEDTLSSRHPLYISANRVDWQDFERAFSPLYCADNGRPAKPIRLMVGLLILKDIRNISDGRVVEQCGDFGDIGSSPLLVVMEGPILALFSKSPRGHFPYICRFNVLSLFTFPSTGPLLQG